MTLPYDWWKDTHDYACKSMLLWFSDRVPTPKFRPVAKEAVNAELIGAVSILIVLGVAGIIVAIDAPALLVAYHRFRENFADL